MNSSRFPGKPMAKIHGIPMIGHCYFRTNMCKDLLATFVATCDQEIFDYVVSIGGRAVMTSKNHERASDRAAEAMLIIEKEMQTRIDIVVMVQGDEPMLTPEMISEALFPLKQNKNIKVVNLMADIETIKEFEDANEVKVVVDKNSDAIYFSREPIPSRKKGFDKVKMLKQVCIIPFERDYLLEFNNTPETELERFESIDMMRIVENAGKVRMVKTNTFSLSVDTLEDLSNVEKKMHGDKLMEKYISNERK